MSEMIDIGGGTLIAQEKVLAISVYTRSKATQRELRIAEGKGILVDVTRGRKRNLLPRRRSGKCYCSATARSSRGEFRGPMIIT